MQELPFVSVGNVCAGHPRLAGLGSSRRRCALAARAHVSVCFMHLMHVLTLAMFDGRQCSGICA